MNMATSTDSIASIVDSMIDGLRDRIYSLKGFDSAKEINAYCDDLEAEVLLAVESVMKHVKELQDGLLKKISKYRNELLEKSATFHQEDAIVSRQNELASLSLKMDQLKFQCRDYLTRKLDVTAHLEEARLKIDEYNEKTRDIRQGLRSHTFGHRFMKFKQNEFFFFSKDHLGTLEFDEQEYKTRSKSEAYFDFITFSNSEERIALYHLISF